MPDPERSSPGDAKTTRGERFRAAPSTRLAVSTTAGIAVSTAVGFAAPWEVTLLAGWDAALAVYVAWVWASVGALDAQAFSRFGTPVLRRRGSSRFAAPDEVTGTGVKGSASFDVTFGYTGAYTAQATGWSRRRSPSTTSYRPGSVLRSQ